MSFPVRLAPILHRFPFPHLWNSILSQSLDYKTCCGTIPPMCGKHEIDFLCNRMDRMRCATGVALLRMEGLRKFKKMVVGWHRDAKEGLLILRNRKDHLPDVRVSIRYHPQMDYYFVTAFSGRFPKDMEDGCFVIHTRREGTNQEVMRIWSVFRCDRAKGKDTLYQYLDNNQSSVAEFSEAMDAVSAVQKYDVVGQFVEIAGNYIQDYLQSTLYNKKLTSSHRLYEFVSKNSIVAEYIWGFNFDTERKRFMLAEELRVSNRNQKRFIRSETLSQLKETIIQKKMIQKIIKSRGDAKSSFHKDEMEQHRHKLHLDWIRVDRYIGKQLERDSLYIYS